MAEPLRVLMIEDSEDDAALVVRELRRGGYDPEVRRVETAEAMRAALAEPPWDVVLADWSLPAFSAPAALEVLRASGRDLPLVIVSGAIGEETAVDAMRAGAHDYVMKGRLSRLVPVVQRELREAGDRRRRRAAEEALARERDHRRLLVEETNALIVGVTPDGVVTLVNATAERVTGWARSTVLGRDWFGTMVPRDAYAEAWQTFRDFVAAGAPHDMETPIVTVAGEERLVAWRFGGVREDDRLVGVVLFGIDTTERRQAEAARGAYEQVARRSEKLVALGTLAAGLAHELNNPVGIISSRIELMLLEGGGLPDDVRGDLEVLHRHAQRVARLAQRLLSFSRQSSGERALLSVNAIVDDTLLLVAKQLTKGGVDLHVELEPDLPAVEGDANALQQVLVNLVTNARDAMAGRGEIHIRTRAIGRRKQVELCVSDTGPGILPEQAARIFDAFYTTKPSGTGLGLSISEGIVREHGGTISVQSAPGHGAAFVITLPVA